MSLYQLVYISIAGKELLDEHLLTRMLAQSRARNLRAGISGLLLISNRHVIQIIEGPKDVVQTLFGRISKDSRHRKIMVIMEGEIRERSFEDWSMGYQKLNPEDTENLPGFTDILQSNDIDPEILSHCSMSLSSLIQIFCKRMNSESMPESA